MMAHPNGPLSSLASAPHAGQWYVAAQSRALPPGHTLVKIVAEQEVVFWRPQTVGTQVQAASAVCSHWGGPLGEGAVESDGRLTCPWHGWQFDVTTGESKLSRVIKSATFPLVRDAEGWWLELPDKSGASS